MTKIEEILNKYRDITRWPEYPEITEDEYIRAMKEYAEWYVNECLKIAAKNVKFEYGYMDVEGSSHKEIVDLD